MPAHVKRQRTVENTLPSQMLALEPRYLFDAAVVTTVADTISVPTAETSTDATVADIPVTTISSSDAAPVEEGNALKFTVSATPSDSLYGVSLDGHNKNNLGSSSLYLIDETTGAGTLIGDIGYAVNSIAFDPTTGLLYGSTTTWNDSGDSFNGLLQIDPSTGAATEIGAFGSDYVSIVGLSFNSSGELFGWHEPVADDLVSIDKATGAATTVGDAGIPGGTAAEVMAFDNSDTLILVQYKTQYDINLTTGAASSHPDLAFDPGAGGADINNTTGDLWASATQGNVQDSLIRVTNLATDTITNIDTDVEYLNALAFSDATTVTVTVDLNMVEFSGSATGAATGAETASTDYEQAFYSDEATTTPIPSGLITLNADNSYTMDVYVKTFDNDPPFNEVNEEVIISLPPGTTGTSSATGIITDSTLPVVLIKGVTTDSGTTVEEGEMAQFKVSLSGASAQPVTVDLSAIDGSADSATDYDSTQFYLDVDKTMPIPGNILTIAADPDNTPIDIWVDTFDNDPPFSELGETFTLTATAATGATGTSSATGIITDNSPQLSAVNDATQMLTTKSSEEGGDEGGEEGSGEEGSEEGGEEGSPGDGEPAEGDELSPEEAAKIEAEVEALLTKADFSETTQSPAGPQSRAEEVAEIMSIMNKVIKLVACRSLPNSPPL